METYLGKFEGSAANPAKVLCSDGEIYALKGIRDAQMIYNDQVCAKLGELIGAPVGRPEVNVYALPADAAWPGDPGEAVCRCG